MHAFAPIFFMGALSDHPSSLSEGAACQRIAVPASATLDRVGSLGYTDTAPTRTGATGNLVCLPLSPVMSAGGMPAPVDRRRD